MSNSPDRNLSPLVQMLSDYVGRIEKAVDEFIKHLAELELAREKPSAVDRKVSIQMLSLLADASRRNVAPLEQPGLKLARSVSQVLDNYEFEDQVMAIQLRVGLTDLEAKLNLVSEYQHWHVG